MKLLCPNYEHIALKAGAQNFIIEVKDSKCLGKFPLSKKEKKNGQDSIRVLDGSNV